VEFIESPRKRHRFLRVTSGCDGGFIQFTRLRDEPIAHNLLPMG
jgi:hypothetical protein